MRELTESQKTTLGIRLYDIIKLTDGIALLVRRMKRNHRYINEQFLQCLADDAASIDYIVNEIKQRTISTNKEG